MVNYFKQHNLVPNRPKLHRTDPTEGGWISKDVNLNEVTSDLAMHGSVERNTRSKFTKRRQLHDLQTYFTLERKHKHIVRWYIIITIISTTIPIIIVHIIHCGQSYI